MKYAHIDKNGQLLGWYDEDIHASIPTPNIEVSDEEWQNAINNNHNKVNTDGTTELYDFRTQDEVKNQELQSQIADAKAYIAITDWVEPYILRHELGLSILPDDSNKLIIKSMRNEKIEFIRVNDV